MYRAVAIVGLAVLVAAGLAFAILQPDGITIVNSGSTNTAAWRIALHSDGSGVAYTNLPRITSQLQGASYVVPIGKTPGRPFHVQASVVSMYFRDVRNARGLNAGGTTCAKSASFGSYTRIHWHGWVSPDLECPQTNAALAQLAQETRALEEYAGIIRSQRVPVPNEPRRTPQ